MTASFVNLTQRKLTLEESLKQRLSMLGGLIGKTVEVIVTKLDMGRPILLWVVLFPRPEVLNHLKVEKKIKPSISKQPHMYSFISLCRCDAAPEL